MLCNTAIRTSGRMQLPVALWIQVPKLFFIPRLSVSVTCVVSREFCRCEISGKGARLRAVRPCLAHLSGALVHITCDLDDEAAEHNLVRSSTLAAYAAQACGVEMGTQGTMPSVCKGVACEGSSWLQNRTSLAPPLRQFIHPRADKAWR